MCDCIKVINEKLLAAGENTQIKQPVLLTAGLGVRPPQAEIVTEKRDRKVRKAAKAFFASYCPFCGEKYTSAEEGGGA